MNDNSFQSSALISRERCDIISMRYKNARKGDTMRHDTYIIGVIGAVVNNIEQRQILSGIISRAQQQNAQVVVLSNLHNPYDPETDSGTELRIYELIRSQSFDALILLSESLIYPALKEKIRAELAQRTDIPVLLVGSALADFSSQLNLNINTSDQNDLEAITDYLIETCGFRTISLLTGSLSADVSNTRVSGYRRSLEKHGISYDDSLVIEGDFWFYSGNKLAEQYLSGERKEPDALICANDYMAFGLLDTFFDADEDITKHFAVIGYEYIHERNLHTPLLTTYQRNRRALGESAVDILIRKLRREPEQPFYPPHGRVIAGQTCPSAESVSLLKEEMAFARFQKELTDWNLRSEMESQLTECRNTEEFADIMGEFLYMVRDAADAALCLFEDWFNPSGSSEAAIMYRSVSPWADHKSYSVPHTELPGIISRYKKAVAGYLNPLYFKDRLLGYCMVLYEKPDTYDEIYLHWLKSVSNGLEFLRLKGDVRYLLQCNTLSPSYDSTTGVFSAAGLRDTLHLMLNAQKPQYMTAIALRFRFAINALNTSVNAKETVSSLIAATQVMKRFQGSGGIIGRISEFDFLLLFPAETDHAALLADAVYTEIISDAEFLRYSGNVQCLFHGETVTAEVCETPAFMQQLMQQLEQLQQQTAAFNLPHYHEMKKLHDAMHLYPQNHYSYKDAAGSLRLNPNYFNRIYQQVFCVSYHQDHILARMRLAKHLLLSTNDTAAQISEYCGYTDSKYFLRQFSAETGCTPKQYRNLLCRYLTTRQILPEA